jgi:hypothetical protein
MGGTILIPRDFIIVDGKVAVDPAPAPGSIFELEKLLSGITKIRD